MNLKEIAEKLLPTFLEAGKKSIEISQKGLKIKIKEDKSPVTDGDLAVNEILTKKIQNLTPDIPIISEETINFDIKNTNSSFWLIDPIDGTKDYINNRDEYTLNAALILNFKIALGVVYAPKKSRLFYSHGKNYAFEIKKGIKYTLNCSKVHKEQIIGLENSGNTPNEVLNIYKKYSVTKKIRISSSYKFCILAAGEADIYAANARAFEWDIAAGHAILEHAGGIVTDHEEKNFNYGKDNYKNTPIIAKRSSDLKN